MNQVSFITQEAWMSFTTRFLQLRKQQGLTQQQMADLTQLHVTQVRRYEAGEAQPSLDAIKKVALAFHVSADWLIFEAEEREPKDNLKLKFEAVAQLNDEEKHVVITLIDSMLLKHQTRQFFQPDQSLSST